MKKIFLTLAFAVLGLAKGFSQIADLQAVVAFDSTLWLNDFYFGDTVDRTHDVPATLYLGQHLSPTYNYNNSLTDSIFGIFGVLNNGPDAIDNGKNVYFITPYNRFLTQEECDEDTTITCSDEERYFWVGGRTTTAPVEAASWAALFSYQSVDSIKLLADWDRWVDSSQLRLIGSPWDGANPYVVGKEYGFFLRTYGVGSLNSPENVDQNPRNNVYVHKIIWGGPGVSIKDMLVKRSVEALQVFPNPAKNEINFKYNFKQNSVGDLVIKDMTGKTVAIKNFGRQAAGEQSFRFDISSLAIGNYIAEFQTGETIAVSKFVVIK